MFRDRSPLAREISNFENSNILNSENLNSNMPNPTLSYTDIQCRFNFAKSMVPEYFGGPKDLSYFLNSSKEFIGKFTFTDIDLNRYFLQYVISQIKGEARDLINLHNPKSFDEIKTILLNKYRDPRSEENLLTLLTTSFQSHNQDFEEFALEINKKVHSLKENAQIEYSDQTAFLELKFKDYERQALYAFISGLKEPYCSFVRQQNPQTLDSCVNTCREYDNIQAQINYKNFLRQNISRKNIPKPMHNQNSRPSPHHQNNAPNRFNFNPNNNFFRNPNNFSPNRPQQRNFTPNPQNNTPNVFKPRTTNNNNSPTPTPMSMYSKYTSRLDRDNFQPRNNNNYNHFARQGPARPGVVVEEIHNTEANTPEDPSENFQENSQFLDST